MSKINPESVEHVTTRLEAMFNTVIDGIITIDKKGVVTSINPAACRLFEYDKEEVIGKNVNILMPSPYREQHDSYLQNYHETRVAKIIGIGREVEGKTKSGKIFPLRLAVSESIINKQIVFTGIIHDLTKEKQAEEKILQLNATLEHKVEVRTKELENAVSELLKTNKQLEKEIQRRHHVEKALIKSKEDLDKALKKERELGELKSRFVSIASHEFRTPLSTILSSASLISKYNEPEQKINRDKHVARIKNSVNNLTTILNDFLSLSKIEEGKVEINPTWINVSEFCDDTIEELSGLLKADQLINKQVKSNDKFFTDATLLKNICYNLLSNAIKYSPHGSEILCAVAIQGDNAIFTVADKGIGIPEKDQKFLFDRFFRAQNVTNIQGTGLGLNIVKRHVELLKGEITFKSLENQGSVFTFKIPTSYE